MTTYTGLLILFSCCIIFFSECPIENENKPLSEKKRKVHKVLSVILGAGYGIASIALISLHNRVGVMILYTLVLIAFLVIIAIFQNLRKEVTKNEKGKKKGGFNNKKSCRNNG